MSRRAIVRHEFVDEVPEGMADGIAYVSIKYATVIHRCCCGCGHEVVTPLAPDEWQLTFDGEAISLHPSIGNWSLDCRSHYWIRRNRVVWARAWTDAEVRRARRSPRRWFGRNRR